MTGGGKTSLVGLKSNVQRDKGMKMTLTLFYDFTYTLSFTIYLLF